MRSGTPFMMLFSVLCLLCGCAELEEPIVSDEATGFRIASLSPGVTATLIDRGHESSLVARHGWDTLAAVSIPVVGDQNGLDYEKLIRTRPTHVFLQWGSRDLPERLETLGSERGWMVEQFGSLTWDDIAQMERRLDEVLGPPEGESAPRPLRMVDADAGEGVRERRGAIGPVLLLLAGNEPAALGPGSFHHTMLVDRLGARSAVSDGGAYIRLHTEDVVRMQPAAIVILEPRGLNDPASDPFDADRWRALLGRLGSVEIPAVLSGRVAVLDHPLGLIAGSNLADVEADLGAILDQWTAGDD